MNEPLTDEQLENSERWAIECLTPSTLGTGGPRLAECVLGLVEEIRRLRSDEWLEAASEEIANRAAYSPSLTLEILLKHRDGA